MKLLTVPQPRASLLAAGRIIFDTRPEPTDYRGPIAIHAASSLRTEHVIACFEQPIAGALKALGLSPATMPRGAVIAVAELVDCIQIAWGKDGHVLPPSIVEAALKEVGFGQWQKGGWAYRFAEVVPIEPLEGVTGARMPRDMGSELESRIRRAHVDGIDALLERKIEALQPAAG